MRLIENWHTELLRLWSIRFTVALFALNGLYLVLPAFSGTLDPFWLAGISMIIAVVIGLARIIKQPGGSL